MFNNYHVAFSTYEEADRTLSFLKNAINNYAVVSVSDLNEYRGTFLFSVNPKCLGWKNVDDAYIIQKDDPYFHTSYELILPDPEIISQFVYQEPIKPVKPKKKVNYNLFLTKEDGWPDTGHRFDSMNELYDYIYDLYLSTKKYKTCKIHDISIAQDEHEINYYIPAYLTK
jgi:hypothetical protein